MPITEAMSMGLPVIVTNWSGITAFVDERVGYMVDFELVPVPPDQPWWFRGSRWAQVNVAHLRQVMRHVVNNRQEAAAKGLLARRWVGLEGGGGLRGVATTGMLTCWSGL